MREPANADITVPTAADCSVIATPEQQMEILEETLHLHRKRVTKQYKKIDMLQKELADTKQNYQSCLEHTQEVKVALQAERLKTEQQAAALAREKIEYSDLQRRYALLEAEDLKWRTRWNSMIQVMKESKSVWGGMAVVSPPNTAEASHTSYTPTRVSHSQGRVSHRPHRSPSFRSPPTASSSLSPQSTSMKTNIKGASGKRLSFVEGGVCSYVHGGGRKSSTSSCTGDSPGVLGLTGGKEARERARARDELRREIEREEKDRRKREEAERANLNETDILARMDTAWVDLIDMSRVEGGKRERREVNGVVAREQRNKEGDLSNVPDIFRKFELEQDSFRKDMQALKLMLGQPQNPNDQVSSD